MCTVMKTDDGLLARFMFWHGIFITLYFKHRIVRTTVPVCYYPRQLCSREIHM